MFEIEGEGGVTGRGTKPVSPRLQNTHRSLDGTAEAECLFHRDEARAYTRAEKVL